MGALMEKFCAIETSRAPSTRLLLAEWESNEPSGKVLGAEVEWVLKQ